MEERSIEQFKKLVVDFKLLTTKVQKDNQIKSKNMNFEHEFLSQLMTNAVRVLMKVEMKTKKLSKGKKY